jgi:NADH dehydrogenase
VRVLVLGGAGFIGRHVAGALAARGHRVVIGSRRPRRASGRLPPELLGCERRETHLERLLSPEAWLPVIGDADVVVNAVGILRERPGETYARLHHLAPGALAAACARRAVRLIHISALGLHEGAGSRFIRSKLAGERAIAACGSNYSIVRPSLLEGSYGARWLRRAASLPLHFTPADAMGRFAIMDVRELGIAVAALCEMISLMRWREVELGGRSALTMAEYLLALRRRPAVQFAVPAWMARVASHLCDALHFSPFSYGHLELMRRDNVPRENVLPLLLARASAVVRKAA